MKQVDIQRLVEQAALLMASLVWTIVVLAGVLMFWIYQDVQARWAFVLNAPPEALAQVASPTATPSPTATGWAGPGPTATPTATGWPTAIPTQVVPPPAILPETFVDGEPTPVVVANANVANVSERAGTASVSSPVSATGSSLPTRLVVEAVGIESDVIPVGWKVVEQGGQQYSIWKVADYAVGWHNTTALLGQPGNTVMAAHNNIKGEVFRDLVNVEIGDRIVAYSGDQRFEYEITVKTIVKEKGEPPEVRRRNARWISPTADERLTLVTCWPYTSNSHRLIVVAQPI